jgi:beta-phosphoglucomutase family hydrolase
LGLPSGIRACLFDLDGVLTNTARLHALAWKEMFDAFLRERAEDTGTPFEPFDAVTDYHDYVDGRLRYDGARSFLRSRGIELSDAAVRGLGDRKNELIRSLMRREGVETYPGSVRYVRAAADAGLRRAVVSASKNCGEILLAARIADLFEEVVDGTVAERDGLQGKPAPDTFLAAARGLGVRPDEAAVFEDALAGVEAGRAGRFGLVVGVARSGDQEALRVHGADVVVSDLAELLEHA